MIGDWGGWGYNDSLKLYNDLQQEINWMRCEDRTGTPIATFVIKCLLAICVKLRVWFTEAGGNYTVRDWNFSLGALCEGEFKRCSSVLGFVSDKEAQKRKEWFWNRITFYRSTGVKMFTTAKIQFKRHIFGHLLPNLYSHKFIKLMLLEFINPKWSYMSLMKTLKDTKEKVVYTRLSMFNLLCLCYVWHMYTVPCTGLFSFCTCGLGTFSCITLE